MIRQGIVALVQSDATVLSIASVGGFNVQLPKDLPLPSWTYTVITDKPNYSLNGVGKSACMRLQIDAYGNKASECILLAAAIDDILSGFSGSLPDADQTYVQGCLRDKLIDFFDAPSRTPRIMLEYELSYNN